MGGASGYTMQAFAIGFSDDYKIFALRYSKPSLLNEQSQRNQTSLCSADSPLLSSPQRLQQLAHGFPAAIWRLSFKSISPKKQMPKVVANATLFLSIMQGSPACHWQTQRVCFMLGCHPCWNSTHRTGTECHHCSDMSLSSLRSRLAFFSESRDLRGKSSRAEELSARRRVSSHRLCPRVPLSLPTKSSHPFSSPTQTSITLRLRAIWSHSVEAMMARWMTACHWRLQMRRCCRAHIMVSSLGTVP